MADRLVPKLRRLTRYLPIFENITGVVMIAVGLYLVVPAAAHAIGASARENQAQIVATGSEGELVLRPGERSEQPRLVEFFAAGCPVCKKMEPHLAQLRSDCVGKRVQVLAVNLSDPRNATAADVYGIRAVPTIKLYDAAGQEVSQLLGGREIGDLRAAAAGLTASQCGGVAHGTPVSPTSATAGCGMAKIVDGPSRDGNTAGQNPPQGEGAPEPGRTQDSERAAPTQCSQ